MSALSIQVPFPVFQGRDGQPLENGYVWIGEPNLNPQTNPVVAYYDAALTIPAAQPLRTINGYVSNAGTPAQVYVDGVNFSILVQDSKGMMVYNFPQGTGISPNASGVIYDPAGIGAVATTVQSKLRESVSVKDFGADPAETASVNTAAFVAAALTGKRVYVPDGVYDVNHSTIVCSDGTEFYGDGTLRDLSTPIVTTGNPNFGFIRVTKNNKISGLKFIGADNRLFAVTGQSSTAVGTVENIRISNLTTQECGIFITEPQQGFTFNRTGEPFVSWILSGPVTPDMIAQNIVVSGCTMEGDTAYNPTAGNCNTSQAHGVAFVYATDCQSVNNVIANARFGNWSYGGGVLAADGFSLATNSRLNQNIIFMGGAVREVFSSYWMSKTTNGVIQGTTTIDFEDVTIDFEGCANCTATGNTTNDIGNGGGALTALAGCDGVDFIANTCTISAGASPNMVNTFSGNQNLVYSGNIFRAYGSATPKIIIRNKITAVATLCPSPTQFVYFKDNVLLGCDLLIEDVSDGLVVSGNRQSTPTNTNAIQLFNCPIFELNENLLNLTVDSALSGQSTSPIQSVLSGTTYGSVDVRGNKITGTTGETGITIFGAQGASCVAVVSDNRTNSIFLDNSWIFSVTNQLRGRVQFERNILPIAADTAHIGASVLKSISGSASTNPFVTVSNAPPTVGTWKVGDVVWKQNPTAGSTPGWVCTTAGTPGTWKDMAIVSV
jgi:hypothetical protein